MADYDKKKVDDDTKKSEPLINPPPVRNFSDKLDNAIGWEGGYKEDSRVRGFIHGTWHAGAGIVTGNPKEFDRAGEQFGKTFRPLSPTRPSEAPPNNNK